jgi:hypothetical protein
MLRRWKVFALRIRRGSTSHSLMARRSCHELILCVRIRGVHFANPSSINLTWPNIESLVLSCIIHKAMCHQAPVATLRSMLACVRNSKWLAHDGGPPSSATKVVPRPILSNICFFQSSSQFPRASTNPSNPTASANSSKA